MTISVRVGPASGAGISIAAGVPYVWCTGRPDTCLLATDCNVGWYLSCVLPASVYVRILN